jgi:signal transduction histidine kinase
LIAIYSGLRFGINKYIWKTKLTLILGFSDVILFAFTLFITSYSNSYYIKFLSPLALAFAMALAPLIFHKLSNLRSEENISLYNDKLLELVLSFSHGKWALRNLNTLILLCENAYDNWTEDEEFFEKLNSRITVFRSMTNSAVSEIINYEKLSGNNNKKITELDLAFDKIENLLRENEDIRNLNLSELATEFSKIRDGIKEIRNSVISKFSSLPTEVINNVIKESDILIVQNNIRIKKEKLYKGDIPVLIRSHELANILNNLIQNSLRFFNKAGNKLISITLLKESPLIIIRYSNNGISIPKEKWERFSKKVTPKVKVVVVGYLKQEKHLKNMMQKSLLKKAMKMKLFSESS